MRGIAGLAALGLLAACAPAAVAPPPPVAVASAVQAATGPYLDAATLERLGRETPLPPAAGSPEEAADRAALAAFRVGDNSPRWTLAQTHNEISPRLALGHFDCPLNARLSQEPPPALTRLFARALEDVSASARVAKGRVFRARPFVDDPEVQTCIRVDETYRTNSSAPSSHATAGIVYGLILADAAPDQAEALGRLGEAFGESRLVCGLHYPADVEAGQALGYALFEAIRATPAYQADLAEARRELAEARALGRTNPACAAERLALGRD